MGNSGIYIIRNKVSDKVYIGQSRALAQRKYSHFHALQKGTHHNKYLQRAFNKDGEQAFEFSVIERCDIDKLNEREVYWIARYNAMDSRYGYNNEGGGNADKIVSERLREAKRGDKNPMYGKKLSLATRERMRAASRGKNTQLTEQQIYSIKERLAKGETAASLANEFNISPDAVYKIKSGKNWGYIHSDLNDALLHAVENDRRERNANIIKMANAGMSRAKISAAVGCTPDTVARVLGERSSYYINSPKNEELKRAVVSDYLAGVQRAEIMSKFNLHPSKYVKLISEAYHQKHEDDISFARKMRAEGMTVKDIAQRLGYARTTITKWTKD